MVNTVVKLPISVFREGKHFVAYSPSLDLSTSAGSYNKAKKRFAEVVDIFFEHTTKKGTLDTVLKNLGWKKVKKQWTPPVMVSQEMEEVKIPVVA